jgi:hypothetical protein
MTKEQWMWMQASVALLAAAAARMRGAEQAPALPEPGVLQ